MRRPTVTVLLALFALTAITSAEDLSNGVLITHYVPGFGGRYEPHGCEDYIQYARITSCDEQNEMATFPDYTTYVEWYVLAAWPEDREFCAVEFGLGDYNNGLVSFTEHGPCHPDATLLPTTDPPWPSPNSGIAIAFAHDAAPSGNFVPIYMFHTYAYGPYYGTTTIPLTTDPATDFIGFASCDVPPVVYACVEWGTLGINEPGEAVCPPGFGEGFACCLGDGSCLLVYSSASCDAAGGEFHSEWDSCDPNPCPVACCLPDESCVFLSRHNCEALGGLSYPTYDTCDPNPCPDRIYACCAGPDGHTCILVTRSACEEEYDGVWLPGEDTCYSNTCDDYTPTTETSWGLIKALYNQ